MEPIKVYWTRSTLKDGSLRYLNARTKRMESCTREMVKFWLKEGHCIWMNPSI
jgi:hypothetical protein